MIKDRLLLKMKFIGLVERIPCVFEMLKQSYLTKVSGEFLKTSQNGVFYYSKDNFELKKYHTDRTHTSIGPLKGKLQCI